MQFRDNLELTSLLRHSINERNIGTSKLMFKGNLEIELYDLATDIVEMNNVAGENPEIVQEIQKIMLEQQLASNIDRFKFEVLGDQ